MLQFSQEFFVTSKATRAFIIRNIQLTFLVLSFCIVICFLPPQQDVWQFHLKMMYLHPAFHNSLIFINSVKPHPWQFACSVLGKGLVKYSLGSFSSGQPNAKPSLPFPYCNENIKNLLMRRVIGLIFIYTNIYIYTKLKVKHLPSLGNVSEVSFWLQRWAAVLFW